MVPPIRRRRPLAALLLVAASLGIAGFGLVTALAAPPVGTEREVDQANRQAAVRLASEMLASVVLPASAQPLQRPPMAELDQPFQRIGTDDLIELHTLWEVPVSFAQFWAFATSHPPSGTSQSGSGSASNPQGITAQELTWSLDHLPHEIGTAWLLCTFAPIGAGLTAVRIDAEVVWLPGRAAQTLVPTYDLSASISLADLPAGPASRTLILGPGRQLRSLIRLINRLRTVSPPGPFSCAARSTSATIVFRAYPGARQNATAAQQLGCSDFQLKVGRTKILLEQEALIRPELSLFGLKLSDLYPPDL